MQIKNKIKRLILIIYLFIGRKNNSGKDKTSRTRVLVFHHIDKPKRFEKIISSFKKKYNFISFEQYLRGEVDKKNINLILAFDDGYKSWFSVGEPIFKKYNIKPLLFVNSDFIDLDRSGAHEYCVSNINTWKEDSLSWSDLLALNNIGCEIGGHTLKHTDLTKKDTDHEYITNSIIKDKANIDLKLHQNTRIFAYPYGRWNKDSIKTSCSAGYKYSFTSDSGWLEDSKSNYKLLRTNVGMRTPLVARSFVEGCSEILTSDVARIKSFFNAS